jgi:hypothetical protein
VKRILSIFFFVALLSSACAPSAATPITANVVDGPKTPQALQPTAISTALFQIVKLDGTKFGVTIDALKTLSLGQVTAEGKVEEGPYLKDVLALAGVTGFKEVTLTGSSNAATLTFEQVDNNTILDFNNHGTMKLSSTYIPKASWTKDIAEIVVK